MICNRDAVSPPATVVVSPLKITLAKTPCEHAIDIIYKTSLTTRRTGQVKQYNNPVRHRVRFSVLKIDKKTFSSHGTEYVLCQ